MKTSNFILLYAAYLRLVTATSSCRRVATCPCGQSGNTVTFCSDQLPVDDCSRWERCKSCQDGVAQCLECPDGLEGAWCSRDFKKVTRRKRFSSLKQLRRRKESLYRSVPARLSERSLHEFCDFPGSVNNGWERFRYPRGREASGGDEYPEGTRVRYWCDAGYTLEGCSKLVCENGGFWSASTPVCHKDPSEASCQDPGFIRAGRRSSGGSLSMTYQSFRHQETVSYECVGRGMRLTGNSTITCRDGKWSADLPSCEKANDWDGCGRTFVESSTGKVIARVLHGSTTEPGEWPWVVAIGYRRGNFTQIECAGALLDSRTVVTAAHCLKVDSYTLYFGKIHRNINKDDTTVQVRQSTHSLRHPDFNGTSMDFDIGLIFFSPRVPFSDMIQPICMPSQETTARNLMTGRTGYVTGWGVTEHQLLSERLMMAQLPVITTEQCREAYTSLGTDLLITQNMFCAGFRDARQAVCSADSGSPLVFHDANDNRYTLEGLVSFGVQGQCGQPGRYTIFTRVVPLVPWLLRNLSVGQKNRKNETNRLAY